MTNHTQPLSYGRLVDYNALDAFKRLAGEAQLRTAGFRNWYNGIEVSWDMTSIGESAAVLNIRILKDNIREVSFGLVDEGLGTMNLAADACALELANGSSYYAPVAFGVISSAANDLLAVGALPFAVSQHLQVETGEWFNDKQRCLELLENYVEACRHSGANYVCGETPGLRGIIVPGASSLSCAASGLVPLKRRRFSGSRIHVGDKIVFLASSGPHINGWTALRQLADERLKYGYRTPIDASGSQTFGEAVMAKPIIYVKFVEECLRQGDDLINYFIPVTGHGLRKVMRAVEPFRYEIHALPALSPLFRFLLRETGISTSDFYGTYNGGVGAVAIVPPKRLNQVLEIAKAKGYAAFEAGVVKKAEKGASSVILKPIDVTYEADTLQLR
jgi:phosphoribosylformylglycinamidine cyclo-ligase